MSHERLVMLYDSLIKTPMGKTVEIDARIVHDPEHPDEPKRPADQGTMEVTRLSNRDIAFGRWRPRR